MGNLNILALTEKNVRFWGFSELNGSFTYNLTENGIVLKPANADNPQACLIVQGSCDDPLLFSVLSKTGYQYGTLIFFGGAYLGLLRDKPSETLAELVAEYFDNLNQDEKK